MIINVVFLLIVFVIMLLSRKINNNKVRNMLYIIAILIMILVSGFREFILESKYVGTDYASYVSIFNSVNKISAFVNCGFMALVLILKGLGFKYIWLFVVLSLFTIISISNFIRKNTKYYELAFFIFITFGMLFVSYNIARQWMACAIFLYGFEYIKKKDLKKYCICILLAATFHISALILLPLYFILNCDIKLKNKLIISLASALTLGNEAIIRFFLKLTTVIDPGYYYRYVTNIDKYNDSCNYVVFIVTIFFTILILLNLKKYKGNYKNWNIELNYLLLLAIISFLGPQHIFYHRLFPYFLPSLLICIPNSVDIIEERWRKIYYVFLIGLFFVAFL